MLKHYKLDCDKNVVECSSALEWGEWLQTADRCVQKDEIDNVLVSTVFIGLGSFGQMFETMVFRDGSLLEEERFTRHYETYTDAANGHCETLKAVREWIKGNFKD